jgi:hypothetical protein
LIASLRGLLEYHDEHPEDIDTIVEDFGIISREYARAIEGIQLDRLIERNAARRKPDTARPFTDATFTWLE